MFKHRRRPPGRRGRTQSERPRLRLKPVKPIATIVKMRDKVGMSRWKLAEDAHLDQSYYKRLESGEARNPGRDVLIRLVRALVAFSKVFSEREVDRVLAQAGYAPAPLPE